MREAAMTPQEYYREQSAISDAGDYAKLFDAVPNDIESICQAAQNITVHYAAGGYKPPKDRLPEVDTRYVKSILHRVMELDDRPLTESRPTEKRFVGCCRDYTMLTVSMMRHKGIPARARYGTADYFMKGYHVDHVVVEYWNGDHWQMVDSQLSQDPWWNFDVRDVPRDRFIVGARGWQMAEHEGLDPERIGLGAELGGWQFILYETILDIAALNKQEMLCWEGWGIGFTLYNDLTDEDKALLDRLAVITQDPNAFEAFLDIYQNPKLKLPNAVYSFTPAANPADFPIVVTL
jgi:hypothetical protein